MAFFFSKSARELAERVGFEPTEAGYASLDFESSPFGHSGTSPENAARVYRLIDVAQGMVDGLVYRDNCRDWVIVYATDAAAFAENASCHADF